MRYRSGVIAVIRSASNRFLVGERANGPGQWQLPQGGIEPGETPEGALLRELQEEIGTSQVEIIRRGGEAIAYDFPEPIALRLGFDGQCHHWFLVELREGATPELNRSLGEFRALDWVELSALIAGVIDWKRSAYVRGLARLGLLLE